MSKGQILVVDDEANLREVVRIMLEREGYTSRVAANAGEAMRELQRAEFDVVVTDLMMPGMSGMELLKTVKKASPRTAVIMITAHGSTQSAIEAMKAGASDYITKPFQIDEFALLVAKAMEKKSLEEENVYLRSELEERYSFGQILGVSPRMQAVFALAERVARTSSTVMITGESGTGKELLARAIHYGSPRRDAKFVSINCGAMPEHLLESELFGHEKGAFTGAIREKHGLFDEAEGGSLFLDEIGETTAAMQVKLLRVLQDKIVRKVGGTEEHPVDVRIIAATNQDLEERVKAGSFREDLYYRINVIPMLLPPLRHRREDIPILADFFIQKYCAGSNQPPKGISVDAIRTLEKYSWPGNVRELENTIERAIALEPSAVITTRSLPDQVLYGSASADQEIELPPEGINLEAHLETVGRRYMQLALERSGGVQTQAARVLHMSFRSFRYYSKKYGLTGRDTGREPAFEGDL